VIDGLTALVSAPEVAPQITGIVLGSMGKGLVAGILIGWFAKKVNSLPMGIVFGLVIGGLFALPFAMATDPATGQKYFWEILIPGSMVGLVVGYLTQRYGMQSAGARA
jgi:F0F1-type ATP synthase assembly protein I